MRRTFLSATIAAVGVLLAATIAQPSSAQDAVDLGDPTAVINSIAPEIMPETSMSGAVIVGDSQQLPTITVDPSAIDDLPEEMRKDPLSFSIDYAEHDASVTVEDGLTVIRTRHEAATAYVQPTFSGVRVLTAIESADAPRSYSYTFDVPEGTEVQDSSGGYLLLSTSGGTLGRVEAPWAKDSAGRNLRTSYSWDRGTLTQIVDLDDSDVSFPVLIDPAWTYTYDYNLALTTPGRAWQSLHSCFNCYFPVEGAPRAWPALNQHLPLKVTIVGGIKQDFACYMDASHVYAAQNYDYSFRAAPGHVDGVGSRIYFALYQGRDGRPYLTVTGSIVNDNPGGFGRPAYKVGAYNTWAQFAFKLRQIATPAS